MKDYSLPVVEKGRFQEVSRDIHSMLFEHQLVKSTDNERIRTVWEIEKFWMIVMLVTT